MDKLAVVATVMKDNLATRWLDRLSQLTAMGFGIGFIPVAPGTFGSLPGLAVGAAVHLSVAYAGLTGPKAVLATLVLLVVIVMVALRSIARTERTLGIHDDQRIVVDEVAGQAIAVAFVPPSLGLYIVAFALFRFLDIRKPSLIGKIDREVEGAWGTLGDDVLAGAIAAVLIYALSLGLAA